MHGLSRTYDPSTFAWTDQTLDRPTAAGSVVYELHVGTFTPEGTLDSAIEKLDHLRSIGVDLVEVMPVNAFNGTHNWGYDGVDWFAVTEAYGGPPAYQRFVDACHAAGLGVVQDVVYNHLGPSGNYLPLFGPYLKQGRNTWGDLVNLDGEGSAEVRRFILDNVRMWFADYHVDALRLDAVHALSDSSPVHILEEMAIETAALSAHLGRPLTLIAESDLNDTRLVTPREARRVRARRPVERRLPPRAARRADRRDHRLLRRLRAPVGAGEGVREGLLPRRHLVVVPRSRPRRPGRHRPHADLAAGRLQPEPRPDRQPRPRRPADRAPGRRPAGLRRAADPVRTVHADAVHGRGVGGVDAVPVLHLPPGAGARQGHRRGPDRGVRADGLGPGAEVPDPQDPATFERSQLDWSELATGRHAVLLDVYRAWPRCAARCPS